MVATAVGGTPEIIEHRTSGLLVPPQTPAALAVAIEELLSDEEWRQRLARQGRTRVVDEFSFAARMRKEEAFYQRILHA